MEGLDHAVPSRRNSSGNRSKAAWATTNDSLGSKARGSLSRRADTGPIDIESPSSSTFTTSVRPSSPAYVPAYPLAAGIDVGAGGAQGSGSGSPARPARTEASAASTT